MLISCIRSYPRVEPMILLTFLSIDLPSNRLNTSAVKSVGVDPLFKSSHALLPKIALYIISP
jgi:hypothetical protein